MTDDERWAAVVDRDRDADDGFLYGVVTTGVYCLPSCPSRRARRENVRFFEAADAAERAGFRACRRCDPRGGGTRASHAAAVAEVCRLLARDPQPTLSELAEAVSLGPHHLHRVFTAATGVTPKAFGTALRTRRARAELGRSDTVVGAAFEAGFGSVRRFYEAAGPRFGMPPGSHRRGGHDQVVRFAVGRSWLGAVLVAATERGLCAVDLGADPEALVRDLRDRFHAAELVGDDPEFAALVARVISLVEDPASPVDLDLDVQGTAFQERVWRALGEVPAGSAVTYAELAERLGSPGAHRAVASACAANPVAVAVPCHRVVRRDGGLAGYRWGVDRKAALLAREGWSGADDPAAAPSRDCDRGPEG
jgi:AraC family transcriptional regulator of adaptative response/methylated-DNA-[protein]-cysteine methyltransferase